MEVLVYLSGYIVAYLFFKWGRKKLSIEAKWDLIGLCLILSLFSWFTVIALTIISICYYINTLKFPKPPRWL